jgi:hypothetical protein
MLPAAVRAFHLPTPSGAFLAGNLRISGLGRFLFPNSPVHTIVRTTPIPGDKVLWLRSFGGKAFLESFYSRSPISEPQGINPREVTVEDAAASTVGDGALHDIESVWPLDFKLEFVHEPEKRMVRLRHRGTTLLGVAPFPRWLVSLDLSLHLHEDERGWDLRALVSVLGGAVTLIGYDGSLRPLPAQGGGKETAAAAAAGAGAAAAGEGGRGGRTIAAPAPAPAAAAQYVPGFHHLLLFDGRCNLCNASVDFVMRHDRLQVGRSVRFGGHQPHSHRAAEPQSCMLHAACW